MDHVVCRVLKTFFIHEGFFIELFTGTESGEFDLDVFIWDVAGHTDHVFGKVEDLHGLSHIEDEDLAALGIGSSLKHKSYRFRNSHEETDDVRVCDRDGTTRFDLLLEKRDDRTMRTQDVAKANGYKRGLGVLCHGLDDHLTDPFGSTHDVRRVDGFIR